MYFTLIIHEVLIFFVNFSYPWLVQGYTLAFDSILLIKGAIFSTFLVIL